MKCMIDEDRLIESLDEAVRCGKFFYASYEEYFNERFGEGWADEHPELIVKMCQVAAALKKPL